MKYEMYDRKLQDGINKKCKKKLCLIDAMEYSYQLWINSCNYEEEYYWNAKRVINVEIDKILNNKNIINKPLLEQSKKLERKIVDIILIHLKFYNKAEIITALLTIKESSQRRMLKNHLFNDGWSIINEYELSIMLINLVINIPEKEFENKQINRLENTGSNLITAISLARIYIILKENIERLKVIEDNKLTLKEITFNLIETPESEKYFDDYLESGLDEKAEDFKIENESIRKKLELSGNLKSQIESDLNEFMKLEFGFDFNDLKKLSRLAIDEWDNELALLFFINDYKLFDEKLPKLVMIDKELLKKILSPYSNEEAFENIMKQFSLNMGDNKLDFSEFTLRSRELRSIYEVDDFVVFGRIGLLQNIDILKKLIKSGHNIEYIAPRLRDYPEIKKAEKRLSTYLSYVIVDRLFKKGYILPMEKMNNKYGGKYVPRAEIDKIKIDNKDILKKDGNPLGDIDVLVFDPVKNQVILIELKNYQPALTIKQMLKDDKSKIEEEESIRKMQARHKCVEENLLDVGRYFGWNVQEDTIVKSIFVTSRANYYAINLEVEYLTWSRLIKKIEKMDL